MRAIVSIVLMCLATLTAATGGVAQWLDLAARTPTPMRQIVTPLATDPKVTQALAATLTEEISQRLPDSVEALPELEDQLAEAISVAVDASLADARIDRAWLSTIDETRAGVVTDLDLVRAGELDDPTLWLNLTPFAGLAQEQIYEATPERLHRFLDEVSWPSELRVPLAHPDPHHSKLAAEAVGLAQGWVWFYIAAGVLALLGLLAGRRRSRWVAVMLGGAVAAAAIAFGHLLLGRVVVADGDTLGRTVAASIAQGSEEALTAWTTPGLYAAGAMAVLGLAGTLVTAVTRPRR